jgi:hypothetical protein
MANLNMNLCPFKEEHGKQKLAERECDAYVNIEMFYLI